MLDVVKKYYEMKEAGVGTLAKIGDAYALSFKKFDENTGEALIDDVVAIDILALKDVVVDLKKQAVDIEKFIAECSVLS